MTRPMEQPTHGTAGRALASIQGILSAGDFLVRQIQALNITAQRILAEQRQPEFQLQAAYEALQQNDVDAGEFVDDVRRMVGAPHLFLDYPRGAGGRFAGVQPDSIVWRYRRVKPKVTEFDYQENCLTWNRGIAEAIWQGRWAYAKNPAGYVRRVARKILLGMVRADEGDRMKACAHGIHVANASQLRPVLDDEGKPQSAFDNIAEPPAETTPSLVPIRRQIYNAADWDAEMIAYAEGKLALAGMQVVVPLADYLGWPAQKIDAVRRRVNRRQGETWGAVVELATWLPVVGAGIPLSLRGSWRQDVGIPGRPVWSLSGDNGNGDFGGYPDIMRDIIRAERREK